MAEAKIPESSVAGVKSTVQHTAPKHPRWTHIALPVHDVDESIEWYRKYTPLELVDRREDADGIGAWLGHADNPDSPFVLVLVSFYRDQDKGAQPTMAPFAHIGIEMPSRDDVVRIAEMAKTDGCLHWPPTDLPEPVGFICAVTDPDGNVIEISHNQGVYDKVREVARSKVGTPALA